MKIITLYPSFANKGGAENMAINIGQSINHNKYPIFLHWDKEIFTEYRKNDIIFEKLNINNILKYHFKGYSFLSHHRKTTTYLILISKIFFLGKLRIVHVAHNTFSSLRYVTLFPKYNIAVSNTVKQNMIDYFGINENYIKVIYNGIKDKFTSSNNLDRINQDTINILFMGRIDPVKQQVEFVRKCKGKLADHVRIYFAGIGDDSELLNDTIADDIHFIYLGLINPNKELPKFDYVCLFSQKEGLPLSLIEGEMFGKPLVTNDIPQNLEVNKDNYTGFVNHSWDDIINCINTLPSISDVKYQHLSKNARSNYIEKFNYNKMVKEYRNYFLLKNW